MTPPLSRDTGSATVAVHQVRMGMTVDEGAVLADVLLRCPPDVAEQVYDQLWLRTILIEQQRRMRIDERGVFAVRADRILEQLDPQEAGDAR